MPTVVVFRWEREGGVYALLPFDVHHGSYCTSYQRVGGHAAADYLGCVARSRPATPAEYGGLLAELRRIGYADLAVRARKPRRQPKGA